MSIGKVKQVVKRTALSMGLYRPARYISDLLTNPVARRRISSDTGFYKQIIKPGDLCFDVGANIGEKSFALLSAGARVVAFEPLPFCADEVEARCAGFEDQRLQVCRKALGDSPGTAVINVNETHPYMSSFRPDWEGSAKSSLEVEVTTLDEAIAEYGRPEYCKIDVEGWEINVLRGLSQTIPLVSFEYHLTPADIQLAQDCVHYLSELSGGNMEINWTPAENFRFLYSDWLTTDQFFEAFPAALTGKDDYSYGDIWVRMN